MQEAGPPKMLLIDNIAANLQLDRMSKGCATAAFTGRCCRARCITNLVLICPSETPSDAL